LATDKEPGALGLVRRRQLPEAVQAAWWESLTRWVEELRDSYPHLWPDRPPEGTADFHARSRKRPWPECWAHHDGLVEDLIPFKAWQEGLLDGAEWAGGPRGWCEWRRFLDSFAQDVQLVAQGCTFGHRGKDHADLATPPRPAAQRAAGATGVVIGQDHRREGAGTG
jgi:hypothetical protein